MANRQLSVVRWIFRMISQHSGIYLVRCLIEYFKMKERISGKRRRIYHSPEITHVQNFSKASFTLAAEQICSSIRIPLPKSVQQKREHISPHVPLSRKVTPEEQTKALKFLRRRIETVSKANAVLSWVATVIAYAELKWLRTNDVAKAILETCILLVSLAQIGLIIGYWKSTRMHAESVRLSINIDEIPIPRLGKSPKRIAQCCLECALHAVVLCPWANYGGEYVLFGEKAELSVEDFLFGLIVARNYHTVRYLYWSSHLSGMRVRFFAHIWRVPSRYVFVLKCYLAEYAVKLIAQIFVIMLVVSALIHYAAEHEEFQSVWNDIWVVAYSQSTIGYGDMTPRSFFGQVTILLSCFVGILLLGLINAFSARSTSLSSGESEMYSHLTRARTKARYKTSAVVLIQRWWRFIKGRLRKSPQAEIVVRMYYQLGVYRRVILKCRDLNYLRLERQVQLLESDIRSRVSLMRSYLRPIIFSETMVSATQSQHFLQHQSTIASTCQYLLCSVTQAYSQTISRQSSLFPNELNSSRQSSRVLLPPGWTAVRRKSVQEIAKAKSFAYLTAMCHSVRRSGSSAESSSRRSDNRSEDEGSKRGLIGWDQVCHTENEMEG